MFKSQSILRSLVVLFALVACSGPDQPQSDTDAPMVDGEPDALLTRLSEPSLYDDGLTDKGSDVAELIDEGATIYVVDFTLSESLDSLFGSQTIYYTNREDAPLDELVLRLFPNVQGGTAVVSEVSVNNQEVDTRYEANRSSLFIVLTSPIPVGEQVRVDFRFAVSIPTDIGGNYGLFGYFDGILTLNEFLPIVPVYDNTGWHADIPSLNGDLPFNDSSFFVVTATVPNDLRVVATGREVDRSRSDSTQTLTYVAGPNRTFYLAAGQEVARFETTIGETVVNSYAFTEDVEGASLAGEIAAEAIAIFSEQLATYPYSEFDIVGTPMQAFGMEYPGMTAINVGMYELGSQVNGMSTATILEATVVHEVAHQWFYDMVHNDQVNEPWLDEAFAQYMTGVYYEERYGTQAAQSYRDSWVSRWQRVEMAQIPIGAPASAYVQGEYGAIVYGRGPIFLVLLEETMGEDVFDAFLKNYIAQHRWKIATSDTFQVMAQEYCNCDLTPLFNDWVGH